MNGHTNNTNGNNYHKILSYFLFQRKIVTLIKTGLTIKVTTTTMLMTEIPTLLPTGHYDNIKGLTTDDD